MSSICPCCNGLVPYGKEIEMPNVGTVGHIDHGKKYTEAEHENILQEKLRQQREACEEAAWETVKDMSCDYLDRSWLQDAVLNAKIDD